MVRQTIILDLQKIFIIKNYQKNLEILKLNHLDLDLCIKFQLNKPISKISSNYKRNNIGNFFFFRLYYSSFRKTKLKEIYPIGFFFIIKMKIYYWSPFFTNIATIKAVIKSAEAITKFSKKRSKLL